MIDKHVGLISIRNKHISYFLITITGNNNPTISGYKAITKIHIIIPNKI